MPNSLPPGRMCAPVPAPSTTAPIAADPIVADQTGLTGRGFARRLERLGPFEAAPRLAVGVSGGADSTALILLADAWARARGGAVLALIVDHGLRDGSCAEAEATRVRLTALGIESRLLSLARPLVAGAGLASRARAARFGCLIAAAKAAGMVHLLLGHHAGDQAETVLLRRLAGSGPAGLAGMAALRESADLRILRPLLDVAPDCLRAWLRARGIGWIEDPTNQDIRAARARLRLQLAEPEADAAGLRAIAIQAAFARADEDRRIAAELARRAEISPLGYAVLSPGPIGAAALAAVWQAVSGRDYPLPSRAIARLAAAPAPATLAGVRLLPAGRLGAGWLLVREHVPPRMAARPGAIWNGFRLDTAAVPAGLCIGGMPRHVTPRDLPWSIRRTLPALFAGDRLVAVPLLGWRASDAPDATFRLSPPIAAAGATWCGV